MFFIPDSDGNLVNMESVMLVTRANGRAVIAHDTAGKTATLFTGEAADMDLYLRALLETLERYGLRFVAGDRSYVNLAQIVSIRVLDNGEMSTVKGMFPGDGVFTVLFKGSLSACVGWRDQIFAGLQARSKGAVIKR